MDDVGERLVELTAARLFCAHRQLDPTIILYDSIRFDPLPILTRSRCRMVVVTDAALVVVVLALSGRVTVTGVGSALPRPPTSFDVASTLGWSLAGETGTVFFPLGFLFASSSAATATTTAAGATAASAAGAASDGAASSVAGRRVSLLDELVRRLGATRSTTSWLIDVGRRKGNPFVQLHQTS